MIRWMLLAGAGLAMLASWNASAAPSAAAPLDYLVQPVLDGGVVKAISIELRFRGSASGETTLQLPNEWGGKDKLYQALSDFSVRGKGATVSQGPKPELKLIRHAPNASLQVRYQVNPADEGPARGGNPYRPTILPQHVLLLGETVFASPVETADDRPVQVRFSNFPKSWALASDLEHGNLTFRDLLSSVTAAGDFRVLTRQVHGAPLRVAIQGRWPFDDESFAGTIASIADAQYDFWQDSGQPYLVTLLQIDGGTSSGGTELGDSFAMFATADADARDLLHGLSHEKSHGWIPRRLGEMPDLEKLEYWLSEGFTDYYTFRMLMRAGAWTPAKFADGLNQALNRYAGSPVRTAPNARIAEDFWKDSDVMQLPYDRGMLFATLVDWKLRRASGGARSLDDVMLAMRKRFDRAPQPIRTAFVEVMAEQGLDVRRDIAEFVDEGKGILFARPRVRELRRARWDPPLDRGVLATVERELGERERRPYERVEEVVPHARARWHHAIVHDACIIQRCTIDHAGLTPPLDRRLLEANDQARHVVFLDRRPIRVIRETSSARRNGPELRVLLEESWVERRAFPPDLADPVLPTRQRISVRGHCAGGGGRTRASDVRRRARRA